MTGPVEIASGVVFASDFRIERLLSRGGMGAVYIAHQISTGRERALKLMHPMLASDEGMRRRFEQEAKIGSRIKSNHVVDVIAAGIDAQSGMPWLAMELLEGEDLANYVTRVGPLPLGETTRIVSQMCHALSAAHAVGVVHRDLKPENVFLSQARQEGAPTIIKLLDLGIAKIVAEAHAKDTAALGTPLWMAPEQTGGQVVPSTDVWAVGLMTFWMLTGRSYWRCAHGDEAEASLLNVLSEIVGGALESASTRAASFGMAKALPSGFDAWFARCVTKNPQDRYPSASELYSEFARISVGSAETLLVPSIGRIGSGSIESRTQPEPMSRTTQASGRSSQWWIPIVVLASVALIVALMMARSMPTPASNPLITSSSAAGAVVSASTVASAASSPSAAPGVVRTAGDLSDPQMVWKIPIGNSPVRGAADAPVTLVEFANYQCPFSKGAEVGLRKLLEDYAGKVRLVWKDDPLAVHSQAEISANVAREARVQKGDVGFWAAHDAFLDRAFKPSLKTLLEAAKNLDLDVPRVEKAIAERTYLDIIAADADVADDFGIVGTPSFFVNGRRVLATPSLDKVKAAIDAELARVQPLIQQGAKPAALYETIIEDGHPALPLEIKAYRFATLAAPTRGSLRPSVSLLEFCDFSNYLCKLVDPMVDELIQQFPDHLGVVWLDVPDAQSDDSRRASLAARAAYRHAGVDGFDHMRRFLLDTQGKPQAFSSGALGGYAESLGITKDEFAGALVDPELLGEIERDARQARETGIAANLPSFLVCGPDFCEHGGYFLGGAQPRRAFVKRVKLVIAAQGGALPAIPP